MDVRSKVSKWHEMLCHDLEVMDSNPSQVERGCAYSPFVKVGLEPKTYIFIHPQIAQVAQSMEFKGAGQQGLSKQQYRYLV